jgi:hypothetical protein
MLMRELEKKVENLENDKGVARLVVKIPKVLATSKNW